MNFRFTKLKTIISALVAIAEGIFGSRECFPLSYQLPEGLTPAELAALPRQACGYSFGNNSIIYFALGFLLVYLVWSLIQKRVTK